jgi:hypothetical protein
MTAEIDFLVRRIPLLTLLALLLWPASSLARVELDATGRVDLGAGFDSNLYLDAYPLPADKPDAEGGVVDAVPELSMVLGDRRSHHLELGYGADLRQQVSDGKESVLTHGGALAYTTAPFGGFRLQLAGRFDQLLLRVDGVGWIGGGGGVTLQRALGYSVRGVLGYEAHLSSYDAETGVDHELAHRFRLELTFRIASGLLLEPEYRFSLVRTDPSTLNRLEHHPRLALRWDLPWIPLDIGAGYGPTIFILDGPGGGTDLLHRISGEIDLHLTSWLDLFVRADHSLGDEGYARHQVLGGVAVQWSWARSRPTETRAREGVLRVTLVAPDARIVAVVGTFNGWDPTRHPLRRTGGAWEGELRLPPGSHQYGLWVDGTIRAPERCERRVADGFGGTSCVVEVP